MNETISLIIAVYNVENFLEQCIQSILNQTYRDIEIILVDDGSKDRSGEICDEYAKKDSRIKVIHKEHGGTSTARNCGIDNSTGKYITFIDSDDFIEENACELLHNAIKKANTNYVMANYRFTTHDGKKWDKPCLDIREDSYIELNDYKKSFLLMTSAICIKLFRSDFLKDNNIRFEEGYIAEDAIFTTQCYTYSPKGYIIKDVIYNYRQNAENSTNSTNCSKEYFKKINKSYRLIYNIFKETNNIGYYRFFCARIMPYIICKIIDTDKLKGDSELLEILKSFDWYFKQKEKYKVVILNERLDELYNIINSHDYNKTIQKIKEIKEYRQKLTDVEKENMLKVSKEIIDKML